MVMKVVIEAVKGRDLHVLVVNGSITANLYGILESFIYSIAKLFASSDLLKIYKQWKKVFLVSIR
jgi:hypothetical protein